jgi:hypothetical protein
VRRLPDSASYAFLTTVRLTAEPASGQSFIRWLGDAEGTATQTTVRVRDGTAVTARFAAQALSLAQWRLLYFTMAELADSGVSGLDADPDRDGYTNAAEYTFATHPRQASGSERLRIHAAAVDGGPAFVCEYLRPANCADVSYRVECSRDGVTWAHNEDGSGIRVSRTLSWTPLSAGRERVTVQLFPDDPELGRVFARIHAQIGAL